MKWIFLSFVFLISPACTRRDSLLPETDRMVILSTVGMLSDVVARIGEGVVEVIPLMGEGVDPHDYTPSARDIRLIQQVDAVFYVGLNLEAGLQRIFEQQAAQGRKIIAVAEKLPPEVLMNDEEGDLDPHVWMDVTLWAQAAEIVLETLIEWQPEHEAELRANFSRLQEDFLALDAEIMERVSAVPEARRVMITAHDAFSYFGRRYGVEVLGIQGISTESEAGLRRINELVALILEREIPAVFVESTVADRNVLALVEGAKAQGHEVRIGGELFSDAMGTPGTPEGTYVGMMRHNARTFVEAMLP